MDDQQSTMDDRPTIDDVSIGNDSIFTPGDNNPTIKVNEVVGLLFMTALAFTLLFSLLRSERRYRRLLEQSLEKCS